MDQPTASALGLLLFWLLRQNSFPPKGVSVILTPGTHHTLNLILLDLDSTMTKLHLLPHQFFPLLYTLWILLTIASISS